MHKLKAGLSQIKLNSRIFRNYKAGDPGSFDLLLGTLADTQIGSSSDDPIIYKAAPNLMKVHLAGDSRLLSPKFINSSVWGPSMLVRAALQKAATGSFSYGQKGFLRTTLLLGALIDNIDLYFVEAARTSKKSALRKFRAVTLQDFIFRRYLVRYNLNHDWENQPNLADLASYLERLKNRSILTKFGTGHFVLQSTYHCGTKPLPRDIKTFQKVRGVLRFGNTMEEMLAKYLSP